MNHLEDVGYEHVWKKLAVDRYQSVRDQSLKLIEPLEAEDLTLQGMPDASPPKWHLAHTTWFFETFLLKPHRIHWQPAPEIWSVLFNSYYDAAGPRHPRAQRGLLSRPTLQEILSWRERLDKEIRQWLQGEMPRELKQLLELRNALQALKGPLGNERDFRKKIESLLGDPEARAALLGELGLDND